MNHNNNNKAYLTVVMPAYNEEKLIYINLQKVAEAISIFAPDYRIIAVNDGSRDKTKEEIERAIKINDRISMISYEKNRGKGYAIKQGMLAADSEYTAFLDSDLELPPYLLKGYLTAMKREKADIVIGSKLHKDSEIDYPFIRRILSYGYYIFLRMLFHLKLKDTQTGIKLFKTEVVQDVVKEMETESFSFDIELLAIAANKGYKIIDQPVKLLYSRTREDGNGSKISVKQIFVMFTDTIKIRKKIRLRKS